jgi:hypothetical protein
MFYFSSSASSSRGSYWVRMIVVPVPVFVTLSCALTQNLAPNGARFGLLRPPSRTLSPTLLASPAAHDCGYPTWRGYVWRRGAVRASRCSWLVSPRHGSQCPVAEASRPCLRNQVIVRRVGPYEGMDLLPGTSMLGEYLGCRRRQRYEAAPFGTFWSSEYTAPIL